MSLPFPLVVVSETSVEVFKKELPLNSRFDSVKSILLKG